MKVFLDRKNIDLIKGGRGYRREKRGRNAPQRAFRARFVRPWAIVFLLFFNFVLHFALVPYSCEEIKELVVYR